MSHFTTRSIFKPVALAAAIAFVYWAVLAKLGHFWWTDENYSHGLLVPFIIGYILWSERARLARDAGRPMPALGFAGAACALAALWAGAAGAELFVQRMSLVLLLASVAVYFWGWRLLRAVVVPLLLLALAIPIPTIIFNKVAFPLQLFASRCAVWAMRAFDIPVLRDGNIIEFLPLNSLTTKKLEVVEACSGIRSLMTLVTLAVVYAYFTSPKSDGGDDGRGWFARNFKVLRAVLIVLAAVPIAILTNAGRVSGTGVLARYYGTEVADGFFHSFSGWVVYVLAFLLLFAFGWLIDRFDPGRGRPRGGGSGAAVATGAAAAPAEGAKADTGGDGKGIGVGAPSAAMTGGGEAA